MSKSETEAPVVEERRHREEYLAKWGALFGKEIPERARRIPSKIR